MVDLKVVRYVEAEVNNYGLPEDVVVKILTDMIGHLWQTPAPKPNKPLVPNTTIFIHQNEKTHTATYIGRKYTGNKIHLLFRVPEYGDADAIAKHLKEELEKVEEELMKIKEVEKVMSLLRERKDVIPIGA